MYCFYLLNEISFRSCCRLQANAASSNTLPFAFQKLQNIQHKLLMNGVCLSSHRSSQLVFSHCAKDEGVSVIKALDQSPSGIAASTRTKSSPGASLLEACQPLGSAGWRAPSGISCSGSHRAEYLSQAVSSRGMRATPTFVLFFIFNTTKVGSMYY